MTKQTQAALALALARDAYYAAIDTAALDDDIAAADRARDVYSDAREAYYAALDDLNAVYRADEDARADVANKNV